MNVTHVTQFTAQEPDIATRRAYEKLQQAGVINVNVGTLVKGNDTVQIICDGNKLPKGILPESAKLELAFTTHWNSPFFSANGPSASSVIEYVQIWFPASRATKEYRQSIESDMDRFDEIFLKESNGHGGLAIGWVQEELEHDEIKDEQAVACLVARGWESMQHFRDSVATKSFDDAVPILLAWGTPFKMWHVEQSPKEQ